MKDTETAGYHLGKLIGMFASGAIQIGVEASIHAASTVLAGLSGTPILAVISGAGRGAFGLIKGVLKAVLKAANALLDIADNYDPKKWASGGGSGGSGSDSDKTLLEVLQIG